MAVVQLASTTDVEGALGRALTSSEAARAGAILDKASELFRAASGQLFTPGESEVRLKVDGGRVYLPQRPVTEVLSVKDDHGTAVSFTLFKQLVTVPMRSHEFVIVKYKHGATPVPDLVRLTIADVARKVLEIDPNAAKGLTQYSSTDGPFTRQSTYATWAVGGQTMLAPDDLAVARSFRVRVSHVTVMVP